MPGLAVISQNDFSGGMWSSPTPERIPANGVAGAQNVLIDDTGGLYRRGGVTNFAGTGWPGSQILWVWQGTLTGGNRTLFATSSNLYSINGGTITLLHATTAFSGSSRPGYAVLNGVLYLSDGVTYDGTTVGTSGPGGYLATVSNRLIKASDKVYFSGVGTTVFGANDFWLIPNGTITGLSALRDSLVVFTDRGTWVISNLALNLTDTAGNVQQRLDLYSPDMILWSGSTPPATVGYQGGLIVPARDGVWLMRLGVASDANPALQLLSQPIVSLYRSYVAAGYQPGQAAIFRGHYFLPILNGSSLIDFLVCRLDLPAKPWTRFEGPGAGIALTPSQDGKSLIGALVPVSSLSKLATLDYFGATALDPDSIPIDFDVITRDYLTGSLTQNTIAKLRVGYRLQTHSGDPAPVLWATYGGATDTGTPVPLSGITASAPQTGGNFSTFTWNVGKRSRAARFQFEVLVPSSVATLQSIEMFVRSQGRQ